MRTKHAKNNTPRPLPRDLELDMVLIHPDGEKYTVNRVKPETSRSLRKVSMITHSCYGDIDSGTFYTKNQLEAVMMQLFFSPYRTLIRKKT